MATSTKPSLYQCLYIIHLNRIPWWRHQMETFSALLAICAGNSPVTGEFPAQRPVTRSFDVSLICVWIYKRLSKQSRGWWFETPSGSLWRHCNVRAKYDTGPCRVTWLNGGFSVSPFFRPSFWDMARVTWGKTPTKNAGSCLNNEWMKLFSIDTWPNTDRILDVQIFSSYNIWYYTNKTTL